MASRQYRHGDLLLEQVTSVPPLTEHATQGDRDRDGNPILAYGEATGHSHTVKERTALWYGHAGVDYLVLAQPAPLVHEEHGRIDLPKGNYRVVHQREYDPRLHGRRVTD